MTDSIRHLSGVNIKSDGKYLRHFSYKGLFALQVTTPARQSAAEFFPLLFQFFQRYFFQRTDFRGEGRQP